MTNKNTLLKAEFIIRCWDIEGFPNYFFANDKKLYRFDSRGRIKQNRRVVIGTTQGYILKQKFYSLAKLRPLLQRHGSDDPSSIDRPADF
ncbi:hypothetical protein GCM10027341_10250 [Spirosoma knui]